jgi:hypothetical protein
MKIIKENGKTTLDYQPTREELDEYFTISKNKSGLKYHLVADCQRSYKDKKRPLMAYIMIEENAIPNVHYYHHKYIPITVSNNPRTIGDINDIDISPFDLLEIKRYIIANQKVLLDVANLKTPDSEYRYYCTSYEYSKVINESIFTKYNLVLEKNLLKKDTGLNTNIWFGGNEEEELQHADRVKIQNNYADRITKNDFISMSIYGDMELFRPRQKRKINNDDLKKVRQWIFLNRNMLRDKENITNFEVEDMINLDKDGNPIYPFNGYIEGEKLSDEITVVKNNRGLFNFINSSGKLLSDKWFKSYEFLQNKVIPVQMEDGNWYRLTTNGKIFREIRKITKRQIDDNRRIYKG